MRIKLVVADGVDPAVDAAFRGFARAKVREFVAKDRAGSGPEWPRLLDTLAELMGSYAEAEKYPQRVQDRVDGFGDDAVATLAALTGTMACLLTMTPEQMVDLHHGEGDAITGYAIAGFMRGRKVTGPEVSLLSHILGTLDKDQKRSMAAMATAFLVTFGFTADEVRDFDYADKGD